MRISNHRPSFDEYFLRLAFEVSRRSDDLFIKHGAIIVDNNTNHIIGTGYNNSIKGAKAEIIKPQDREYRRPYMQHAEKNSILNSTKMPLDLIKSATIYVTGQPCVPCLQDIISFGINRIVYVQSDKPATITENEETAEQRKNLLSMSQIKVETIPIDNPWLIEYK